MTNRHFIILHCDFFFPTIKTIECQNQIIIKLTDLEFIILSTSFAELCHYLFIGNIFNCQEYCLWRTRGWMTEHSCE